MNHIHSCCLAAIATALLAGPAAAGGIEVEWELVRPSNTGVPGEEVRFIRFAPDGTMWVAARWPFWVEGGIGIYDFTTQTWTTHSSAAGGSIPSAFVNDVERDANGIAWIATNGGLVRFDGTTWTVWNTSNSPLLHDSVRSLDIGLDGHIWVNNSGVQTTDAAIWEFDGFGWTMYQVGAELPWALPWKQLSDVMVDGHGHVWVANEVLNGLAEYDGSTWTLHGASVNRFTGLREDTLGNLWMVAGIGGGNAFYLFDHSSFTLYSAANTPFSNTTITTIGTDTDGTVYVGNWMGQVIATTDTGETWSMFSVQNAQIFNIAPHPESADVWVGTPGAARHLDANGTWLEAFNSYNSGMPDYFIDDIAAAPAPDGRLWFASAEAGVSSFDGERWFNLGSHNPNEPWPLLADGAQGVMVDSAGNTWFGSNGVGRWDGTQLTAWDWQNTPGFPVAWFDNLTEAGNGHIFAGEFSGVYIYDGSSWSHPIIPGVIQEVEDLATDQAGNVWAALRNDLAMHDGTQWNLFPALNVVLFDRGGPNVVREAPDGTIWIGTDNGLVAYDGVNWLAYDQTNTPLEATHIVGIDFRLDGLMAISSLEFGAQFPNGVSLIDGPITDPASWTSFTFDNSPLPHYQLGRARFDAEGNLWVSAISEAVAKLIIPPLAAPGDLDGDGVVGTTDLLLLLAAWGDCPMPCPPTCPADLDADCTVGTPDLLVLLANWG